jgi:predicted Fe-S protein YdhL (DUF1289 family)
MEDQKPRRPVDMVVYMYLNIVTEKVYIGSSMYGLEYRHRSHTKHSKKVNRKSRFYKALSSWPDELWERVVLQRCSSQEELDAAEKTWIAECSALDEGVGYNTYDAQYLRMAIAGGEAMKRRVFSDEECALKAEYGRMGGVAKDKNASQEHLEKKRLREEKRARWVAMSDEERSAFYSECGKKGADFGRATKKPKRATTFSLMSKEEQRAYFSECGKRGAGKAKSRKQTGEL